MGSIRPLFHVQAQLAECQESHPLVLHGLPMLTLERPPLPTQTHPTENRNILPQECTTAYRRQSRKAACKRQQQL